MEARLLPHVAPLVPLPVPRPEWVGHPDDSYPWPFLGYRRLAGRPASNAALDERACLGLARPLAEFLKSLHAVPVGDAERWGAGPDVHARLDAERLGGLIRPVLADLVALRAIDDAGPWLAILERGAAAPLTESRAVVHGDFYSRHVLVDEAGYAAGVIDFGDMHVGSVALDLSIAWSLLPPAARRVFFDVYGAVDKDVAAKAQMRALSSAVMQESYGRRR